MHVMLVQPLNDDKIDPRILEMLKERFKDREIPTAYRILARNPSVLLKFIEFRDTIMKKGVLDPILKEKIALRVSAVNSCEPCLLSHKKKLELLNVDCDAKDEYEATVLEFAERIALNRGKINNLKDIKLNEDEILEIALVTSLYMFLNTFNNLLVWTSQK